MSDPATEDPVKGTVKDEGQLALLLTMTRMMAGWIAIVVKSRFDHRINKTEKFYDMAAARYRLAPATRSALDAAKKYLREADRVLDFGCADGTMSIEIAGRVKEVYGIDISPGMIDAANRKARENKTTNAVFLPIAIFDERLEVGSFDVILAFNILHAFHDGRDVTERIHGLLKPGGLLISLTPCMGERKTFLGSFLFILVRTGVFPYIRFFRIAELENLITAGGFRMSVKEKRISNNQPLLFMVAQKVPAGTGQSDPP